MRNLVVIGLSGKAGVGKSTAASRLVHVHNFTQTRFAAPLKAMLRAFLYETGLTPALVNRMIEGDLKEVNIPELGGATPRYAMQTLGTEWGRQLISRSLWTDAWKANIKALTQNGHNRFVVEDCRFVNEIEAIHSLDGIVIEIAGTHSGLRNGASGHSSEGQTLAWDQKILNDGSLDAFTAKIDRVICEICPFPTGAVDIGQLATARELSSRPTS